MNRYIYLLCFAASLLSCTPELVNTDHRLRVGLVAFETLKGTVLFADSIQMHSPYEATLYISGAKMKVVGEVIQPGTNPNFKKK